MEAEIASLRRSKETLEDQEVFLKGRYDTAANRAAELARENMALEKTVSKVNAENARLLEQVRTSVAQVRLTLQAEVKKAKDDCRRKENVANLLIQQARRSGIRLAADDAPEETVEASEVRRRAADWWRVKKERDALEGQVAAYATQFEEEKAERDRREELLNVMRNEDEERRKRAVKKSKELERKCKDLEEQLELAEERLKEMEDRPRRSTVERHDSPVPLEIVEEEHPLDEVLPQEPEAVEVVDPTEPSHSPSENVNPNEILWRCHWVQSTPDGGLRRCTTTSPSKEVGSSPTAIPT